MTMLTEQRADELKAMSKDELITLLLETEDIGTDRLTDIRRDRDETIERLGVLSRRLNTPIAELIDVADVERERDRLRAACEAALVILVEVLPPTSMPLLIVRAALES